MTLEQQRIAIAKACGWKWLDHPDTLDRTKTFQLQGKWVLSPSDTLEFPHDAPDYLNDLNAMYEAMETLTDDQLFTMSRWLQHCTRPVWMGVAVMHSKAAQRAEAFLKTLNLYK